MHKSLIFNDLWIPSRFMIQMNQRFLDSSSPRLQSAVLVPRLTSNRVDVSLKLPPPSFLPWARTNPPRIHTAFFTCQRTRQFLAGPICPPLPLGEGRGEGLPCWSPPFGRLGIGFRPSGSNYSQLYTTKLAPSIPCDKYLRTFSYAPKLCFPRRFRALAAPRKLVFGPES